MRFHRGRGECQQVSVSVGVTIASGRQERCYKDNELVWIREGRWKMLGFEPFLADMRDLHKLETYSRYDFISCGYCLYQSTFHSKLL